MIRPHLLLLVTFGLPLTGCATEGSVAKIGGSQR